MFREKVDRILELQYFTSAPSLLPYGNYSTYGSDSTNGCLTQITRASTHQDLNKTKSSVPRTVVKLFNAAYMSV